MTQKYKLVKPSRGPYWLIRLEAPCADGWREKSTREKRRREAERAAAKIMAGISVPESKRLTWKAFRAIYEREHLATLKRPGCFRSAAKKLESLSKPVYLDELNSQRMKTFKQKMLSAGIKPVTAASYLKHIRAALGWAEESGYLEQAPRVRTGSTAVMKGRAITVEEYERLILAVPKIVGRKRKAEFVRLLSGLWLMGLRLQEALDMDWQDERRIRPVNLDGTRPLLSFPASEHKNAKDQYIPITPEAVAFLRKTPKRQRQGKVFPINGSAGPIHSADRASRIISAIGRRAGIVTKIDERTGIKRHATAHDLRRSFATRLAKQVPADLLQTMMRHADLKTTRTHYAEIDAEQQAEALWKAMQ